MAEPSMTQSSSANATNITPTPTILAKKDEKSLPQSVSTNVTNNKNINLVEEEFDDEEYEYEYEDEETGGDEVAIEVDDATEMARQQAVQVDEDGEEDDDAEYERIANKIDELLDKTSVLQSGTSAMNTKPTAVPEVSSSASPSTPNVVSSTPNKPDSAIPSKVVEPIVTISGADERDADPNEEIDLEDEDDQMTRSVTMGPFTAKQHDPVKRANTMDDLEIKGSASHINTINQPGSLKHFSNNWNISDINDEESIHGSKDFAADSSDIESESEQQAIVDGLHESLRRVANVSPVSNLDAIHEEDYEPQSAKSVVQMSPIAMPSGRYESHITTRHCSGDALTLSQAMADDDDEEVNEIEIALEEWKDDSLSGGGVGATLDEVIEEEDEQDEVDDQMPDNLLRDANDQIEQIDLPLLSPSPNNSPAIPLSPTRRPISPSSMILHRVRNMVISGQLAPLEALLDSVPNFFIDAILKAGWTALMYASYRGYPDIVDFCLKRGADCNYHKEFFTSLMAVCSSGNTNEGQLLLCMDFLLEHGARVNAVDKFGCSPLHYAARFGRALLSKCLCEHGAYVNHVNRNGWSALHWASAENHGQVVATLLDQKADVHLQTRDGLTASQLAAIRRNHEVSEALHEIEMCEASNKQTLKQETLSDDHSESCESTESGNRNQNNETKTTEKEQQSSQPIIENVDELPERFAPEVDEIAKRLLAKAIKDAAASYTLRKESEKAKNAESKSLESETQPLRQRHLNMSNEETNVATNPSLDSIERSFVRRRSSQTNEATANGIKNMIVSLIAAAGVFIVMKIIYYLYFRTY